MRRLAIDRNQTAKTILLALALGPLAAPGRAENVMSVGYGEAAPGARGVPVVVTASNDVPLHGYSVALAYPANVLRLTSVSTEGTHVAALAPDFVAPRIDNDLGIATLGVIFSFRENATLKELPALPAGSRPRIVARLSFDVLPSAVGGSYRLELVDGIGTPANFNRFSDRGASIAPRLEDGTFVVAGGNILTLEKKFLFPGLPAAPKIRAYVQHPEPLLGFQIGFTFSKSVLELRDATWAGTSLGVILGNIGKIETWNWKVDLDYSPSLARADVASLFDALPPIDENQVLPPCTSSPTCQDVAILTFALQADADKVSQYFDLHLEDTGRPGDIDNRFIVVDRSLDPRLVDGRIYFSQGNLRGRVVEALSGEPVSGATVVTDPDGYTAKTDASGAFLLSGLPAGPYRLILSKEGFYTARHGVVESSGRPIVVQGDGKTDDAGDLPIYQVPPSGRIFVRGRVNGDRKIDLSDAVSLLGHLFRGEPEPSCMLAADTNDDNRVDLSDAIWLLNHLFLGGPEPPPPFDATGAGCGPDPTPGSGLDCREIECF